MEKQLNKLTKAQLIDLAKNLLTYHEMHYKDVEAGKENVTSAFYQYCGNVQAIRQRNSLPNLY